jgi:hypothetical protein
MYRRQRQVIPYPQPLLPDASVKLPFGKKNMTLNRMRGNEIVNDRDM